MKKFLNIPNENFMYKFKIFPNDMKIIMTKALEILLEIL